METMRLAIFVGLLLAVCCGRCHSKELVDLHVMGLFPMEGSWSGGEALKPAVEMGLDHVNARDDILPGYRLKLVWENTKCDPGLGTDVMYRLFYEQPPKLLIIGDGCSIVSQATGQASHLWNVIQVSYASVSPALSDKERFPLFFRLSTPDSIVNPSRIEMMNEFNWQRVATIHQSFELFSAVTDDIVLRFKEHNISLLTSEIFTDDPSLQVQNLKKQDARIIIAGFYEDKAFSVFCEAYKVGLYGPKYVWFLPGWFNDRWWEKNVSHVSCTPEQISQVADGYMSTGPVYLNPVEEKGVAGLTSSEYVKLFEQRTNNQELFATNMAPPGYDTAWAVALALNATVERLARQGNTRIEDFTYDNEEITTAIYESMKAVDFVGVRGHVKFDSNGDPVGLVKIDRIQDGRMQMYGLYHPSQEEGQRIGWLNEGIPWAGGRAPRDSSETRYEKVFVPTVLYAVFCAVSAAGMILATVFLCINLAFAKVRLIKMSSPNLNNMMLLGCMISFTSVFCQQLQEGAHGEIICKMRTATIAIGFSTSFGALFSKTWRVHVIFTNHKMKKKIVKDFHLLGLVFVAVAIDVFILVLWEIIDPLKIVTVNYETVEKENGDLIIERQADKCDCDYKVYFTGALYAIKGLLLIFGAFLAWETRTVRIPALNDSKLIGMCIYNVVLLSILGVTLTLVTGDNIALQYGLGSAVVIFGTCLTICIIFIPKLVKLKSLKERPEEEEEETKSRKRPVFILETGSVAPLESQISPPAKLSLKQKT